jgi:hypothetical protein
MSRDKRPAISTGPFVFRWASPPEPFCAGSTTLRNIRQRYPDRGNNGGRRVAAGSAWPRRPLSLTEVRSCRRLIFNGAREGCARRSSSRTINFVIAKGAVNSGVGGRGKGTRARAIVTRHVDPTKNPRLKSRGFFELV